MGIYAQRYNAAGATVGSEFRVNTTTESEQLYPSATALNDGSFVITWTSLSPGGSSWDIYAQRYDATGAAIGGEFRVNTVTEDEQSFSSVTALDDGGFLITWSSRGQDGYGYGVYGQRYDWQGAAVGGEYRINATTTGEEYSFSFYGSTTVATLANGRVVSVFDGASVGEVYARLFELPGMASPYDDDFAGTSGNDTIDLLAGNDSYDGLDGHDSIFGGEGNDTLNGNDGNDTLDGGLGDDTLLGGLGDDSMEGGSGNDSLTGGEGNNTLLGGQGDDILLGGSNPWTGNDGDNYLDGGSGDDAVFGGDSNDTLLGGTGNDILEDRAGSNVLDGGDGDDWINGGDGSDTLFGSNGNDTIFGDGGGVATGGNDLLDGGEGDDALYGYFGDDTLLGGGGNDDLTVEGSNSSISGGDGDDTLASFGQATMDGGDGNDFIVVAFGQANADGGGGNDLLIGFFGNDTLAGGPGNDTLAGGEGDDTLIGGEGIDTVDYDEFSISFGSGIELTLTDSHGGGAPTGGLATGDQGIDLLIGIENVIASRQNDIVTGNSGNNVLQGRGGDDSINGNAGNDSIDGGEGNDFINGGAGNDTLAGSFGNDTIAVDSASNIVTEAIGEGFDRVNTLVNYTLGAGQEIEQLVNITLSGLALTGNEFNNHLIGAAAADTLNGGLGNDTLDGRGGADSMVGGGAIDWYFVDHMNDVVIESTIAGGGSNDRVNATVNWTLGAGQQVEEIVNILTTGLNLTGNELDNRFFGAAGDDTLNGGAGNDTIYGQGGADSMVGGAGNDIYFVDNAGDVVIEAAGQGTFDRVYTSINYTIAAGQEIDDVLVLAGSGSRQITGNEFTNRLYGDSGNDTLSGNGGNDYIDGRGGNDILSGGTGIDTVVGGAGNDIFILNPLQSDRDIFPDFNFNFDRFQISNAEFGGGLDVDVNGVLDANRFVANATGTATSADQRFIYDTTQRLLIYDSNGNTAGGVQVVVVTNASILTAANFNVVA